LIIYQRILLRIKRIVKVLPKGFPPLTLKIINPNSHYFFEVTAMLIHSMGVNEDLKSLHVWTHNMVESLQSRVTILENELNAHKPKPRQKLKLKDPKS
jgi:hypothetical protein